MPTLIDLQTTQAAHLASLREHTMPDSKDEGKSGRDLLWLASARLRVREMPHPDPDNFERTLLLLNTHLKAACKPFAEAIAPPPPPPGELTLSVPAGYTCTQWHEASPRLAGATIEPTLTFVYCVSVKPPDEGVEGAYHIGKLTLPRAGVLATSRLLQQQSTLEEPTDPELPSPLRTCLRAIKELLLPPLVDPEASRGPVQMDENGEPIENLQMKYLGTLEEIDRPALTPLLQLFDPLMGGTVTHAGIGNWLSLLLSPECQELEPLQPKE